MSNKHLIALDLDGTLLRDDKTISPKTKQVLKQIQDEGHIVMIATGRPFRSSGMYYKELNLSSPIVNFNGAFIHHPLDEKFGSYHEPLDLEVVKQIVDTCFDLSFYNILAEVLDQMYLHYHDEKLLDVFRLGAQSITTGDLRKFLKSNPTSLLIHAEETNLVSIREALQNQHAELIEQRSWGAPFPVLEIIKKGINKAIGVKKVADYYNIPYERVIAFGDEDNDLEMLSFAKYGVAMGNGIDSVKEIARDVTLSNEEDGVAVYLEKLLLS